MASIWKEIRDEEAVCGAQITFALRRTGGGTYDQTLRLSPTRATVFVRHLHGVTYPTMELANYGMKESGNDGSCDKTTWREHAKSDGGRVDMPTRSWGMV